ncbi:hypothetical protein Tco_0684762 [Tanacetum coccineum]
MIALIMIMIMGLSRVVRYLFCRLQRVGETPNDDINHTPQLKPTMLHETSSPSWAEGSRRSLINVDLGSVKPNAVVAQDGSGNFKTIVSRVFSKVMVIIIPEPWIIKT